MEERENMIMVSFMERPDIVRKIKALAHSEDVSEGLIIRRALRQFFLSADPTIEQRPKQDRCPIEA